MHSTQHIIFCNVHIVRWLLLLLPFRIQHTKYNGFIICSTKSSIRYEIVSACWLKFRMNWIKHLARFIFYDRLWMWRNGFGHHFSTDSSSFSSISSQMCYGIRIGVFCHTLRRYCLCALLLSSFHLVLFFLVCVEGWIQYCNHSICFVSILYYDYHYQTTTRKRLPNRIHFSRYFLDNYGKFSRILDVDEMFWLNSSFCESLHFSKTFSSWTTINMNCYLLFCCCCCSVWFSFTGFLFFFSLWFRCWHWYTTHMRRQWIRSIGSYNVQWLLATQTNIDKCVLLCFVRCKCNRVGKMRWVTPDWCFSSNRFGSRVFLANTRNYIRLNVSGFLTCIQHM